MQLDILLRTHDQGSVHGRDVPYAKKEIVHRCTGSLFAAIGDMDNVKLTIIDDHSSDDTIHFLHNGLQRDLHHLEGTGNNASMVKVFGLAAESTADLVYIVEDDYLHYPEAISEMLATWEKFSNQLGNNEMAMTLVDCPANYHTETYASGGMGRDGSQGHIVGGINRAWRTNTHTGGTFITTPEVINTFWGAFEDMALNWPKVDENTTWNRVWESRVRLFTPLIPLAYHLSEIHPYHPHDKLWRSNKIAAI